MMPQSLAPSPQCHPRFSGEISALAFELVDLGPEDRRDSYAARKEGRRRMIGVCSFNMQLSSHIKTAKKGKKKTPVQSVIMRQNFLEIKGRIGFISRGHLEKRNRNNLEGE